MLAIINYGTGNLSSIRNMLKKIGYLDVQITNDPDVIKNADRLILPGVGHFDFGMQQLRQSGLEDLLHIQALEKRVPVLGICLGAQLLTRGSEEGHESGLGWIPAFTRRFNPSKMENSRLKVPHMGWSEVTPCKHSNLVSNLPENPRFYFVHTYHIVCEEPTDELLSSVYGYPFTAAVQRNNIMGVQFHPEKSHRFGMALLRNFMEITQ